ncbi:hypothetical protein [Polaribacter porphyrae]|uniref:Uncharacterized protein n=1 Tax=Polaribacter porphyrae TaxID=1137780 RepID=A0A2S7WSA5_9FLAO|nr:hypothetical protein [Polaribacter porphyrae]PQJ80202.1 hypothetical protein BTO18_13915 [Polaribacter porphyrae]
MKKLIVFIFLILGLTLYSQKTIHVFVALCDNINQGIVPVPKKLGNGQNPKTNLYWGALYGVKTHFKRSNDWTFIKKIKSKNPKILERVLFKHKTSNIYLLADAYDGKYIKNTTIDFLEASAGHNSETIKHDNITLKFGGDVKLLSYVGHDGLMEFSVKGNFIPKNTTRRDVIILACISKNYFKPYIKKTKANPLVWTTGLMAPEAYTLKWAIDGWIKNETDLQIRERAAKAYNNYQKCGLKGAKRLLVTGFKVDK